MTLTPTILATGVCNTTADYTTPSGYVAYIKKIIITNTTEDVIDYAIDLVSPSGVVTHLLRNTVLLGGGRCELENIILPASYSVLVSGSFNYTFIGALEN